MSPFRPKLLLAPSRSTRGSLAAAWLVAGLLLMPVPSLRAGTLTFYNVPGNTLLQQDGVTALDTLFKFELGTFETNFTPTGSNITDWTTNWKPFARAESPSLSGWNSSISYFNKTGILQLDGTSDQGLSADVFAQNELAYIWVYNIFSLDPGSQWALVTNDSSDSNSTDDWLLPSPSDALPREYALSNALNPIWGGLHNVQGGGDFTAPLTAFTLQTHAVPEPSGAFMILLAGLLWRIKRARQA